MHSACRICRRMLGRRVPCGGGGGGGAVDVAPVRSWHPHGATGFRPAIRVTRFLAFSSDGERSPEWTTSEGTLGDADDEGTVGGEGEGAGEWEEVSVADVGKVYGSEEGELEEDLAESGQPEDVSVLAGMTSRELWEVVRPELREGRPLARYVHSLGGLQRLVAGLGVSLHVWANMGDAVRRIVLRADFERDVAPAVDFLLSELRLPAESVGPFLTRNPYIFQQQSLHHARAALHYLLQRRFAPLDIVRMARSRPLLFTLPSKRLDEQLLAIQTSTGLSPAETKTIVVTCPHLLLVTHDRLARKLDLLRDGFLLSTSHLHHILLGNPAVLVVREEVLVERFALLNSEMSVPNSLLALTPGVLSVPVSDLRALHLFLKLHGRAQYDPSAPRYVSLQLFLEPPIQAALSLGFQPRHMIDFMKTL